MCGCTSWGVGTRTTTAGRSAERCAHTVWSERAPSLPSNEAGRALQAASQASYKKALLEAEQALGEAAEREPDAAAPPDGAATQATAPTAAAAAKAAPNARQPQGKKRLRAHAPGGGMGALAKKAAASVAVAAPAPAPDQAVEPAGAEERPDAPLTHASKERGPSWAERAHQLQQLDQYQDAVKG